VSEFVVEERYGGSGKTVDEVKKIAKVILRNERKALPNLFTAAIDPKFVNRDF
jgi:hypothetical protein